MKRSLPALFLILTALPAMAHPPIFHGLGGADAAQAGFFHPFSGMDHLIVMVAIGLWAVQMGGRALWLLPTSFVGSMMLGGLLGLSGFHAPIAESGILASIVLVGAALGMTWNPRLWIAALFVSFAGLCHGYAHGAEMAEGLVPAIYLTGMIVATALLHSIGIATGLALHQSRLKLVLRITGFAILAFALYDFIWPVA